MNKIDLSKYEIKEIIHRQDDNFEDIIKHLSGILNDRSIPENQKQLVKKQFDEVMELRNATLKPSAFVLSPKNNENNK